MRTRSSLLESFCAVQSEFAWRAVLRHVRLAAASLSLVGIVLAAGELWAETVNVPADNPLSAESRVVYEQRVLPFLKQHCWKCHGEKKSEAGFNAQVMGVDFLSGKTANHWREAINKINLGKMPPEDEPQPDPKEVFAVVEWVSQELRAAEKRAQSTGSRAPMRRLNRTEYSNSVCDLFHLDRSFARTLEKELPADGKVDGFDRGGAGLFVDRSQLQAYLDSARLVVDAALPRTAPEINKFHLDAIHDTSLLRREPGTMSVRQILDMGDYKLTTILDREEELERQIVRGPGINDFNFVRDGGVETSMSNERLAFEHMRNIEQIIKRDGWYRFRMRAGADRGRGKFATDQVHVDFNYCRQSREHRVSFSFEIDAPLDKPQVYEKTVFLRVGAADFRPQVQITWNSFHIWGGYHDAGNAIVPDRELRRLYWWGRGSSGQFQQALERKESPAVVAAAKKDLEDSREAMRQFILQFEGPVFYVNPTFDPQSLPRLWYQFIDVEGPLVEYPTKASRELLAEGEEGGSAYAREIFGRLLPRAYRRPVSQPEVDALVRVVELSQQKRGKSFAEAVRDGVATVLTSPHFLYLEEPTGADDKPRPLSDYELASRLSYFLWSSMPDAELFELAAQHKLRNPQVLSAQVRRMVADPRAAQFVESFVGQWAKAREFNSATVDVRQYKDYDDALRDSGLREPYEFFGELLRSNESVLKVLDSDFLVINERLAKHYGIRGVDGEGFRRVPLAADRQRGGLLGMAGLLTWLADGTRTQPVKRGAYVLDVLWNRPAPPPPPNVGDLPAIKGKNLTVRQRLEQHRATTSCASCHAKIDPLGLALENYDAIGAWRERQNGERRTGGPGDPPIDPSGVLPDGKAFGSLAEFKQRLLEDKELFLQGFTEKLLAYALGRPVGAADQELVNQVMSAAAGDDYRLPAFLQAVVATGAFETK